MNDPRRYLDEDGECTICLMLHRDAVEELAAAIVADPSIPTADCVNREASHLHAATEYGALECVKLLCEHGADIEARDPRHGTTPLFNACMSESRYTYPRIVEHLLFRGANPNVVGPSESTPLSLALVAGEEGAPSVVALLSFGAKVDLRSAIFLGRLDFLKRVLEESMCDPIRTLARCDPINELVNAIFWRIASVSLQSRVESPPTKQAKQAIIAQYRPLLAALVEKGFPVNPPAGSQWGSPIFQAVSSQPGEMEIVPLLVEFGADVNAQRHGKSCLDVARKKRHMELVDFLLAHGAKPANP